MSSELFAAIEAGDLDAVGRLVAADRPLAQARDQAGVSAIMAARYRNRLDIVEALRRASPAVPLDVFEAAALGDLGRLQSILDSDLAQAHSVGPDGFPPLSLAAFFGQVEAAQILLKAGADPRQPAENPAHLHPLHAATAMANGEVVELLLRAGADPNAMQEGGWTPLMAAAARGDTATADRLISAGADPTLRNDQGLGAADLAAGYEHHDVADRLTTRAAEWRARHPGDSALTL